MALRQVVLVLFLVTGLILAAAVAVLASDVLLIIGLAVLFGVFLTKSSDWLSRWLNLTYRWALAAVTVLLLIALLSIGMFVGLRIDQQIGEAGEHLDQAQSSLRKLAETYPSIRGTIRSTPYVRDLLDDPGSQSTQDEKDVSRDGAQEDATRLHSDKLSLVRPVANRALDVFGRAFKTTLGLVVNSLLIFFVGLFLAVHPANYRDGIAKLFPLDHRDRVSQVLDKVSDSLWRWLIGRFGSMLVTGVGAGGLLFFLGVPMAGTLGLVTALLTFVPNIGGLVAVMLAVLFAIPQGGNTILMVLGGYALLQLIESYLVTPLIQQSQVSLPPALLIAFQAVLGVAFGLLGAAIASPLLAGLKVLTEEFYVKDFLERDSAAA